MKSNKIIALISLACLLALASGIPSATAAEQAANNAKSIEGTWFGKIDAISGAFTCAPTKDASGHSFSCIATIDFSFWGKVTNLRFHLDGYFTGPNTFRVSGISLVGEYGYSENSLLILKGSGRILNDNKVTLSIAADLYADEDDDGIFEIRKTQLDPGTIELQRMISVLPPSLDFPEYPSR